MAEWDAFASDGLLEEEIRRLITLHGIQSAVETGTYHGVTAEGLAALVSMVYTIEIDAQRFADSRERLSVLPNVKQFLGSSVDVLPDLIPQIRKPALYYLDAHWDGHEPLPQEVEIIALNDPRPVIVIHDMLVPGHPELYAGPLPGGSVYCYEWVQAGLEKIQAPWRYYYNDQAEGLKIGIMFVVPDDGLLPQTAGMIWQDDGGVRGICYGAGLPGHGWRALDPGPVVASPAR